MGFVEAIKTCLNKYVTFSGRAGRAEFWWFYLFSILVGLIPLIGALGSLALFLPFLAATVRRVHDRGFSGWWILGYYAAVLVLIGGAFAVSGSEFIMIGLAVVLSLGAIVFLAMPGQDGPNAYGDDPRGLVDTEVFR